MNRKKARYTTPTVRDVGGKLVLVDSAALAVVKAVSKRNCVNTLKLNTDRVAHFKNRLKERSMTADEAVIVILNVDDIHGGPLAEALMPGHNWQEIRERGEIPFARGLAERKGIQKALNLFDEEAAEALEKIKDVAVVVVDHGVAEAFVASLC